MPEYRIYGLRLRSDEPIPTLLPAPDLPAAAPDVEIILRPAEQAPDRDSDLAEDWYVGGEIEEPWLLIRRLRVGGDLLVFYPDGTRFRLSAAGDSVSAWWPGELTIEDTAVYLLGPVLGIVLSLRGEICLHGSVAELKGGAVGFIGPSGAGKSTTAATLARQGQRVLSDDLLVVARHGDRWVAQPGYPSLRLWPESVEGLYGSPEAIPPIVAGWEKRHLDLEGAGLYTDRPVPLTGIYVLGGRRHGLTRTAIEPLGRGEAMLELVANTFAARLPIGSEARRREFETLGELAAAVPVRRLVLGDRWRTTADLSQSLSEDLAEVNA